MSASQHPMRQVWVVSLAHTAIDFYMTLFPPFLAFFKTRFGLSTAEAALLPAVVSVFGAVPQPFMGYLGDRRNRMALAALGVLVCGGFISLIGLAPSAPVLALLLFLSALGSSTFHPTGGGLVTAGAPERSNLSLSIFLTGGTLGMALSPVLGTQFVERYGIASLWVFAFPCVLFAAFLFLASRSAAPRHTAEPAGRISLSLFRATEARPLWTLYAINVLRSLIQTGFVSFTALLGQQRGWNTARIGWVLSAFLIASTLGRVGGGYLGDRVAPRKLLSFSCAASAPFFAGFAALNTSLSLPLFFLAGCLYESGTSTSIVLAQRILPRNTSTATGLMMGFAWALAGLLIPLVGVLADAVTVSTALVYLSAVLLPAAGLVFLLPAGRLHPRTAAAANGD